MFGNSIEKINQQIADLERLRNNFVNTQQPIQNIINTNSSISPIEFEARFIKNGEKPEEIIIQRKTAFIDLNKDYLAIKEMDGSLAYYQLIKPKTEEQIRIEELERKLSEYEARFINANNEISKPTKINNANDENTTTKSGSRRISKESE